MAELVVVILWAYRRAGLAFAWLIGAAVAITQVTLQIGFLDGFVALLAGQFGARHFDVRDDALSLNLAAVRREVQRRGELQGAIIVQWQHGLYRALAEAISAHQHATLVILQGTGDDFGGRGAAAVDQHDQGHVFAGVGRIGIEAQFGVGDASFCVTIRPFLRK